MTNLALVRFSNDEPPDFCCPRARLRSMIEIGAPLGSRLWRARPGGFAPPRRSPRATLDPNKRPLARFAFCAFYRVEKTPIDHP